MSRSFDIAVIPGDGIGREVIPEGVRILEAAGKSCGVDFVLTEFDWSCEHYSDSYARPSFTALAELTERHLRHRSNAVNRKCDAQFKIGQAKDIQNGRPENTRQHRRVAARETFGQIAIANSDVTANAMTECAFEAAALAVGTLTES